MQLPTGISLPNEYQIVSCARCGGCYANTSAVQADYDHYYSVYNNYSGQGVDRVFNQILSLAKRFGAAHLECSSNILDIGFGNGELLRHLQDAGYGNLFGVDPSTDSVNNLNRKGKIHAYCKSIYDEPESLAGMMDVVFMTSVLEHLLNPRLALQQACRYIKDGGYLIVNVPDYSMCDRTQLPIPNQFNQEHINYFSECSFQTMLGDMPCGLLRSELIESNAAPGLGSEYNRVFIMEKQAISDRSSFSPIIKDTLTRASIEKYFTNQEIHQERVNALIHKWNVEQIPIIVWGTGAWTMSLLAGSDLSKCNIIAYTDGNRLKIGTEFEGTTIIAPKELENYPDATILICAMRYAADIEKEIVEMGLQNPVVTLK